MVACAPQAEPILLTTPPLPPDPIAAHDTVVAGAVQLDRMEADVKALQQKALATQKTLEQLQARDAAGSDASFGTELPLAEGAWGLAAVMLAFALVQAWQQRRRRHVAEVAPDDETSLLPATELVKTAPPVEAPPVAVTRVAAVGPEFADASDSDWGVSQSVDLDGPAGFDVKAAASEVARVRNALAQRRKARAQERAEDARRLHELTEQTRRAAEELPAWSDSKPFSEVLDVTSDDAVASVSIPSAPAPFWHRPSQRGGIAALSTVPIVEQPALEDEGETLPSFDNVYAVKLALAKESAAVDLWIEARDLIREVLESDDPELQAQAHALMATIERRKDKSRLGL